jgi:peptide/nickel transport system permease protein
MKALAGVILAILRIVVQSGLIVLFTYFLINSLAPPVNSQEEYFAEDVLHRHLPAFYFSVLPGWYSPTLALLPASPVKSQGISLMRQGWTLEEWQGLQRCLSSLSHKYSKNATVASMRYENEISRLQQDYREISSVISDSSSLLYRDTLNSLIFSKKSRAFFSFLPVIHFWGKNNSAHKAITAIFSVENEQKNTILFSALKWSVVLAAYTLFFSILIGTFFAYVLMRRQVSMPNKRMVQLGKALADFIYLIPVFGLATLAIPVFTTDWVSPYLHWFPGVGSYLVNSPHAFHIDYFFLPALIMSLPISASLCLRWLAGFDDELSRQYVLVLKSKGLSEHRIIIRHILRNLAIPILVFLTMITPALISGALIIENIFAIPGLGRLTLQSIKRQDEPMLLMITGIVAVLSLVGIYMANKLIPVLNPRTKVSVDNSGKNG